MSKKKKSRRVYDPAKEYLKSKGIETTIPKKPEIKIPYYTFYFTDNKIDDNELETVYFDDLIEKDIKKILDLETKLDKKIYDHNIIISFYEKREDDWRIESIGVKKDAFSEEEALKIALAVKNYLSSKTLLKADETEPCNLIIKSE